MSAAEATPIASIASEGVHLDLLVGVFAQKRGGKALMLTNYADSGEPAAFSLAFDPGQSVTEVSKESGKSVAIIDADEAAPGLQLSIAPGDGRLFLVAE